MEVGQARVSGAVGEERGGGGKEISGGEVGLEPKVWVHKTIRPTKLSTKPLTKLSSGAEGMVAATITSNSFVILCLDFVRFGLNLNILFD